MLQNYIKIAWRTLWKQRTHAVVNIIGLAIGLAVCLLIVAYVLHEQSYDRFNRHHASLYRVVQHQQQDGTWYEVARTPAKLAGALKADFPEVKNATRFALWGGSLLTYRGLTADEPNRLLAEPSLFDLFTFPFVRGNPRQALAAPHSIVLTQRLARRYFGKADPMGQLMVVDRQTPVRVTGVIRDIPANSHLQFDYIIPLSYAKTQGANLDQWGPNAFYTYVQLHDPAQQAALDGKLTHFAEKTFSNPEEQFYLQPLTDIHLYSRFDFNSDFGQRGDSRYVQFFTALALLVLLLGCLNFTNLSTARALTRAKEVGLRKAIGARRQQLIGQFLAESALIVLLAGALAVGLVETGLPFLSSFLQKSLALPLTTPVFWLLTGGVIVLTIVAAGSYPALLLSSSRPVRALRGQTEGSFRGSAVRKGLVIGQFVLSVAMMIAALLIDRQLRYLSTKKLGLQKDRVVYVRLPENLKKNLSVVKEALRQQAGVQAVSATESLPFSSAIGGFGSKGVELDGKRLSHYVYLVDFRTDFGFIETMGLTLSQGRSFFPSFGSDTVNLVLNEAAVRQLNLRKPVGTRVNLYGARGTVVGVVRDFHFADLRTTIQPAVLRIAPRDVSYLLVRIAPGGGSRTVAAVQRIVNKYSRGFPVETHFLSRDYEQLYRQEQTAGVLFAWFTGLAILVSCLGLFGLAAFTTEQRTKEIGVRKVLGASVGSIIALLSKDFLKLVLVAVVLAPPLAGYAMSRWLQNFAYKTAMEWWVFLLAALLALTIAFLTVSWQSVKAALMNPVDSLRSE